MKNILLIATSAILIAGAAQAEVEFVKGEASVSWTQFQDDDLGIIDAGASAAFSMGNYGFQFGGTNTTFTYPGGTSVTLGSSNAHLYYQGADGNKYGVFYSPLEYGLVTYGVEGMFSFGPMDVEAYAGTIDLPGNGGENFSQYGVEVFYGVTSDIEVSAGYSNLDLSNNDNLATLAIGASYDIPNTNLAATASYESMTYYSDGVNDGEESMYTIGLEWSFGPNQDERLFGNRGSQIFIGG